MSNKRNDTCQNSHEMKFTLGNFQNCIVKREEIDYGAGGDYNFVKNMCFKRPKRVIIENSLPAFAIKKKNSCDSVADAKSEVFFRLIIKKISKLLSINIAKFL